MMKLSLLLLILPCLIVADTQCDGGELSCPQGKTCCTVNGKAACCDAEDLEATLPQRSTLLSATTNATVQNAFGDCTMFNCDGTCCNNGCCGIKFATCCSGNTCCDSLATCCSNGCCPFMSKCCGSWCCKSGHRCGLSYMTCFNAAAGLYPTTLVTLIAVWVAAYVVTKL